jgi:hypothetical protein
MSSLFPYKKSEVKKNKRILDNKRYINFWLLGQLIYNIVLFHSHFFLRYSKAAKNSSLPILSSIAPFNIQEHGQENPRQINEI